MKFSYECHIDLHFFYSHFTCCFFELFLNRFNAFCTYKYNTCTDCICHCHYFMFFDQYPSFTSIKHRQQWQWKLFYRKMKIENGTWLRERDGNNWDKDKKREMEAKKNIRKLKPNCWIVVNFRIIHPKGYSNTRKKYGCHHVQNNLQQQMLLYICLHTDLAVVVHKFSNEHRNNDFRRFFFLLSVTTMRAQR